MRELWGRIIPTSGTRVYSALVGVLILSITARHLGPEGRGQLATITTWVTMFATLGSLSLGQIAIHRAVGSAPRAVPWLTEAFRVFAWMTCVVALVSWALAGLVHWQSTAFSGLSVTWLLLGFLAVPLMVWDQYGSALLMAREQLHISNRAQFFGRTVAACLVAVLVGFASWGVAGALLATLLGQMVTSGWVLTRLATAARPIGWPRRREILDYVLDGLKLHLNAVGVFLISGMDILMVNHYRGSTETGFYQLGVQLTSLMLIVPQAAAMVAYGRVTQLGPDNAWPQQRQLLMQTTMLIGMAALLAGSTAPFWLPLVAGADFEPAIDLFRWQLLGLLGMTFSAVMAPQWISRGYFWQASMLTVAIGLTNFVANLVLIPRHGMYGAVWASLGSSLLAIVANARIAMLCESRAARSST